MIFGARAPLNADVRAHMIVARAVFCLSLAATLFWALGFVVEWVITAEPPIWSYAVPAIFIAAACAAAAFRLWPRFLTWEPGKARAFWTAAALWTVLA